jgi:hypothetical protein
MRAAIGDRRHVRSDGHHKVRLSRDAAKRLAMSHQRRRGGTCEFLQVSRFGCRWHIGTRREKAVTWD